MTYEAFRKAETIKDWKAIRNFVLSYVVFFGIMLFGYFATVLIWQSDAKFSPTVTQLRSELK